MEFAILDDNREVDLVALLAIQAETGKKAEAFCPCCNVPFRINQPRARFFVAKNNFTVVDAARKRKPVPFKHPPGTGAECAKEYDKRFKDHAPDAEYIDAVRAKNRTVFADPKIRASVRFIQSELIKYVKGSDILSAADREEFDRIADELISIPGLHQYPWALPYLQVLCLGSRDRRYTGGWHSSSVYTGDGRQKLKFTDVDGVERKLELPYRIIFSRVTKNDKPKPEIPFEDAVFRMIGMVDIADKRIVIPVSQKDARDIVEPRWNAERAAIAATSPGSGQQRLGL